MMTRPSGPGADHTVKNDVLGRILRGALVALAMVVPTAIALFGAWIGTSLAVHRDGPVWLAAIGAVAAFFLLPLGWELWADRGQRGGRIRDAILRSSFLSTVFVVVLVGTHPKDTFEALATRGDWFLGGAQGETADDVRGVLFSLADGLEWLNDWVRAKAFREGDDGADFDPGATIAWSAAHPGDTTAAKIPGVPIPGSELVWPLPAVVHPAVLTMPDSARVSIASVGAYIGGRVQDPFMRVKAVHDFVATWVRYDYEALRSGAYRTDGNWKAERVFERRRAVCSGYAELAKAIGAAAGAEIIVLSGDARSSKTYRALSGDALPVSGDGHAWNAAKIGGAWYLFDATWDSDGPFEDGSPGKYRTTYLFIPPRAMALDHRPDEDRWQLLEAPLSRGDWLREPLLVPLVHAFGLEVTTPRRPIVTAAGAVRFEVANPHDVHLRLGLKAPDEKTAKICARSSEDRAVLVCPAAPGRWEASLFARLTEDGPGVWLGGAFVEVD